MGDRTLSGPRDGKRGCEISPEFSLAVECCRRCFIENDARVRAPGGQAIDWPQFLRLVRFHRVQGLAWRGLGDFRDELPADVRGELARDAQLIAARNLGAAVECGRLQRSFCEAGLPLLFVKGLTLAVRLYGDAWSKSAVDVDLLVRHEDLASAADLLEAIGYRLQLPASRAQLEAAHRWGKESSWINPSNGVQVDLHSRLSDNPRLIPGIGIGSGTQEIRVSDDVTLPTLCDDALLAYLSVHGASSAWFRLKWIVDFAALVEALGAGGVEKLYSGAKTAGAGRALDQAMLLADALFGTLRDAPDLRSQIQKDSAACRLVDFALGYVAMAEPSEPTATRFGTTRIHISQFLLRRDLGFKFSELIRQVRAASV